MGSEAGAYLRVAVSSRALFDLTASDDVYRSDGLDAYRRYQIERENEVLAPGEGFVFVRKLLDINKRIGERVDVILLSRNTADTGLRIFNSIREHDLGIVRAAFCGGASPYRYATAFDCHLFLSADADDTEEALKRGVPAARLLAGAAGADAAEDRLRIAFDGDAVLFSDEAERVFRDRGLEAFSESEAAAADQPLRGGPFKPFLSGLHRLQGEFDAEDCPIRTALVTARGAPAHERIIKTLRAWDIRLDESLFLGGLDKTAFLRAYRADIFFDDQSGNCLAASGHVTSGHVPHGVRNEAEPAP